jgi:hypothetical protein
MEKIYHAIRHNYTFKSCIPEGNIIVMLTKSKITLKVHRINKSLLGISEKDEETGGWHVIHTGSEEEIIEYINS